MGKDGADNTKAGGKAKRGAAENARVGSYRCYIEFDDEHGRK